MVSKSAIKQVLLDQREEQEALLARKLVTRENEADLRAGIEDKLIKVIMGGRRCGKSTLALRVLSGLPYVCVNFDDERLFGLKTAELNLLLEAILEMNRDVKFILLDEVQNIEGWELFVNRLQRQGFVVIVTGSNAHLPSHELATHLTGRHRTYDVYPFSFREYLLAHDFPAADKKDFSTRDRAAFAEQFAKYFRDGGFPEITEVANPRVYLQELYNSTLTRDIAMRHGVRHIRTLKDIAGHVAANCGSKLSFQNVAQTYSLGSVHTARNYISYLQEAYLFFSVEAFSFKSLSRVRRPRKMYSIDTALVRATVAGRENIGLMLENIVFVELLRRRKKVYYYADSTNRWEVDFVVCDPAEPHTVELLQVCADMSREETRKRELRGLLRTADVFGKTASDRMHVLTMDYRCIEEMEGHSISCTPVWEWILLGEAERKA